MSEATPAQLRTRLAGEFDQRGWEWDPVEGGRIIEEIVARGTVDPRKLVSGVSSTYRQKIAASRRDMEEAIEQAVGGLVPRAGETARVTFVSQDNRQYHLSMAAGAQISGDVNVGGTQINIKPGADRGELLAGVAALVRAGLLGNWDAEAARALGAELDRRDDLTYTDVEEVTAEVVREEAPEGSRARELLGQIAAGGLGSTLGTGLTTGIAKLVELLAG